MKIALPVCLLFAAAARVQGQGLPDNLTVTSSTPPPYQANLSVQTSGTVTVNNAGTTTYTGGTQVVLTPGFTAIASSGTTPTFIANIAPPPFYPNNGSGGGQNFYVTASDPSGYQNITFINIIYNWQPTGVDGCQLTYDVQNDALTIGDLTGSMSTFGSISLVNPSGTLGDLVNSNCQVIGLGSSITKSGNNITLFLNTHFRASIGSGDPVTGGSPGFVGQQNIYMMTQTADQQQPGSFQLVGAWTAFPVPNPGTYSSALALTSFNSDGTVTLEFNDPNGYNYQPYGFAVLGSSYSDPNACRIRYDRGGGSVNHVLSLYAGDFSATSLIGTAPVGTPGAVVQDNVTCILDIGNSYVVQEAGDGAIVHAALRLKTTGTINTYAQGFDRQNTAGALTSNSINVPSNSFSLSPVSTVSVQQSGPPAAVTLNIPVTGTFSGPITTTVTAPAGVTAAVLSDPVTVPAAAATTVQVSATAAATPGMGTIAITGTDSTGTLQYQLYVPLAVSAAQPAQAVAPPNGFAVATATTAVYVQQSGEAAVLQQAVTVPGTFTGAVALSYTAPQGVAVTLPTALNYPSAAATTVLVSASETATVGPSSQPIVITGTSGTLSSTLTIPVAVTSGTPPPPPGPTPTFVISGTQTLPVTTANPSATFTVTFTALNGFPSNQQIAIAVDPSTSQYVSVVPSSYTAYANGSITVTVTRLAGAPANLFYAVITATSGSIETITQLGVDASGVSPNLTFSVPSSVTVDASAGTTILGAVSQSGGGQTVNFSSSVSCSIANCTAGATFGTLSNGTVPIALHCGNVPITAAFHITLTANGVSQDVSASCKGSGSGAPVVPTLTPVGSPFTYNDSSTSQNFLYQCGNCTASQFAANSCSSGTPTLFATVNTAASSGTNIYLNFEALSGEPSGAYQINCLLINGGPLVSAGYVQVQSAPQCAPSITSVQVNGQATNTVITGTSGYVLLTGQCLSGAQSPRVDGSGISITSYNVTSLGGTSYQINASFQSSPTATNGGQHNLTVTANQGTTSSTVFATTVTLSSVSFTNSYGYSRDCRGNASPIASPTWPAPSGGSVACPQIGFSGDHAVYKSGDTMKATAVFTLNPALQQAVPGAYVQGATAGFGTFAATGVPIPAGQSSFPAAVTIDTALAASQTQFISPLNVHWSIAQAGTSCASGAFTCVAVGTSANPVYVTLAKNVLAPAGSTIMLTYVSLAVGTGGATNQTTALANTWAEFSTGSGPANVQTWDGRTMSYYTAGFGSCALDASHVVQNLSDNGVISQSAQCGAFALLFESALAMNGIHSNWITIIAADGSSSTPHSRMVIDNWTLSATPAYADATPSIAPWIYRMTMNGINYSFDYMVPAQPGNQYGDLANNPGISGQGENSTSTPPYTPAEKVFDSHFIVQVGCNTSTPANPGITACVSIPAPVQCIAGTTSPTYGAGTQFYDPSYGAIYQSERDFELKSVTGYATQNNGDPTPGTLYHFHPIEPAANVCFTANGISM